MPRNPKYNLRAGYNIRVQCSLIAALALTIALVRLWPSRNEDPRTERTFRMPGQETIAIEQILQTRFRAEKPPPPPPLVPIVVSDQEVMDDIELDLPHDFLAVNDDDDNGDDVPEGDQTSSASRMMEPRPVRIVEPEYTRDARKRNIRAEVVVEVLVDERGQVKEVKIVDRFLLGKNREREEVVQIGYGLEESALDAAQRWMFRPARYDGEAVRAYTKLVFSFGV